MRYRRVACTPPADMKVAVDNFGGAGAWMRLSIDVSAGTRFDLLCCPATEVAQQWVGAARVLLLLWGQLPATMSFESASWRESLAMAGLEGQHLAASLQPAALQFHALVLHTAGMLAQCATLQPPAMPCRIPVAVPL